MIKVCKSCSNLDIEALSTVVPSEKLNIGCFDNCALHADKPYGMINGEIVVADNQSAFEALCIDALQSSDSSSEEIPTEGCGCSCSCNN